MLKVYGGLLPTNEGQRRAIVATTSKKKASILVGESYYYFNRFWAETGNTVECETASKSPNTVFVLETNGSFVERLERGSNE